MMKIMGNQKCSFLKVCLLSWLALQTTFIEGYGQKPNPLLQYSISMTEPANHLYHVTLLCNGLEGDTIDFKMPRWMPGYYQIMEYSDGVKNFSANNANGRNVPVIKPDKNTWRIVPGKNTSFSISYDVYSDKKFVASNYLDTTHGYIVTAATFMYIDGHLDIPVNLKIVPFIGWKDITTGLDRVIGRISEYTAPDFDILYDCPILIGNLEKLPSFDINGVVHYFMAYNPGSFNRDIFISSLKKTVMTAIDIMGDIPYSNYTFIGIGPGYGGIEHLNNTTVSFSGNGLEKPGAMIRMLKFLGHEYFHNYNVKRIRPYELGPFDYDRENRTNLLWVSEGLSVYYEYLIVKRAGLMNDDELMASIESNINTIENDAGRQYQSLSQASYETWDDGPFGNKPGSTDKSISYYEKGPLIGMILDFSIRNATENRNSLDDVMRFLYQHYYKKLHRGFTDAEFQQACQEIAGISLSREFEYVYTTKEIDYLTYLSYAGLKISEEVDKNTGKRKFTLAKQENMNPVQLSIFKAWSGN
jgi:predicted metalloprotease with PDZ domain